jgi:formate-dependent nitrite reductase cytochrome c552 subunit
MKMSKKFFLVLVAVLGLAVVGGLYYTGAEATPAAPPAPIKRVGAPVDVNRCYACHAQIKDFHADGKHATVNCIACHGGLDRHLKDVKARPTTRVEQKACATCHFKQYESFFTMNWEREARDEKSQLTGKSPNPAWDMLMMPHGFTREHNLQRSHAFMLIDHLLVDRAFGGRFQPKDGWRYLALYGDLKAWDVLYERFTEDAHRPFMHGTGAFANPTCLNCKTQDHILDWAYMGDPVPGAKWSRVSKVYDFAKTVNHPMNCYACHDPHSARPRVVRDALIEALTRPTADTVWHKDPNRTKIEVYDMGLRGFTRKIAKLEKPDSILMCAQCHVEYIGNPGIDIRDGKPVGMADIRTNHFQMKDVWSYNDYMDKVLNFREFRHGITGAILTKIQHPEVEVFLHSKHHKAGAQCSDCHMPKMKDKKTGVTYTSHWQTNPRHYLKETCLQCHTGWTETQAKYVINSVENHLKGKARKAEHWIMQLISKFVEARAAGVDEAVLNQARDKHWRAHVHWEWWTAETSAGFHNIDQAKESLNTSMIRSMEGIMILEDAIKAKRGTDTTFTSPVRARHFIGVEPVR